MMKKVLIIVIAFVCIGLIANAQMGEWTWMNGSNVNNLPVWGTQGSFASGNTPPGVYEACQWTDNNGKFWMYGGLDSTAMQQYSDLWEFDPAINQWAWIKGPGTPQSMPVYGSQGVPAIGNSPGARAYGTATWVDNSNNLWLFGGWNDNWGGVFADLWKYNIATNEWTWMKGTSGPSNSLGSYGIIGVPSATNFPPARCETNATWSLSSNNLWLFGGQSFNGCFNDLWNYNISSNQWTWVNGPNSTGGTGSWGTKGVPSNTNIPSARMVYAKWKDHLENLWLFGGCNGDSLVPELYNDLWKYNYTTNQWTWMSGTDSINSHGVCNGTCMPSVSNYPAGRFENRSCAQMNCDPDHFIFFGGGDDLNAVSRHNDLWDYDVASNQWTLMGGSVNINQPSVYGTIMVSDPNNHPGARMGALAWIDPATQNFWMFGGIIVWQNNHANDMWRFVPDTACPNSCLGAGIPEFSLNSPTISLFPNPTTGIFTLSYHLSTPDAALKIVDISGRVVYKQSISGTIGKEIIDASALSNGMYFYQLTSASETWQGKVVVER